jgi:hypothetical protein
VLLPEKAEDVDPRCDNLILGVGAFAVVSLERLREELRGIESVREGRILRQQDRAAIEPRISRRA